MWEGYANDILTGLQKNPGVQPDRPIWELVQNARDVAYENKKAKIVFIRKQDHFVFQHNGQPFTRTTLQSLILQTSSKVREDIIQVGQYGTGFLWIYWHIYNASMYCLLLTTGQSKDFHKRNPFAY